jgi:hypothetical protein
MDWFPPIVPIKVNVDSRQNRQLLASVVTSRFWPRSVEKFSR